MSARSFLYAVLSIFILFTLVKPSAAQTSAYGTVMLDAFGFAGSNYSSGGSYKGDTGGITAGAFYNFHSSSRLKAGIDGRITYSPGYKGGSVYTGALRFSFVPHRNRLRPYFQIGGGVASTQLHETVCNGFTCDMTTTQVTNGVAHIAFGLDIRTSSHLDIRALDYGADAGSANGSAHAVAGFLDAGVVYHF